MPGTSPTRTAPPRLLQTTGRAPWCPEGQGGGGRAGARLRAPPEGRGGERGSGGPDADGSPRGLGSPPSSLPTARGSGAAAHLQPAGGTRAGRRIQRGPAGRGSGLRCGFLPGGDVEAPGWRLRGPASPPAPSEPSALAPARVARGQTGSGWGGAGPAGLGWGRRRQGPPPLTGSRRRLRRLRSPASPLPQPGGEASGPGFWPACPPSSPQE